MANETWLMIGDFNETRWQSEHFSMTKRSEGQMASFSRVLSICEGDGDGKKLKRDTEGVEGEGFLINEKVGLPAQLREQK